MLSCGFIMNERIEFVKWSLAYLFHGWEIFKCHCVQLGFSVAITIDLVFPIVWYKLRCFHIIENSNKNIRTPRERQGLMKPFNKFSTDSDVEIQLSIFSYCFMICICLNIYVRLIQVVILFLRLSIWYDYVLFIRTHVAFIEGLFCNFYYCWMVSDYRLVRVLMLFVHLTLFMRSDNF